MSYTPEQGDIIELDFNASNAVLIEQAPQRVIDEALKKAKLIIS